MQLTSSAFGDNQPIPDKYAYRNENISPPLEISGIPNETKSLALIVHDPDAQVGDYTHWLVWNIPATATKLIEGTLPSGAAQGTNDFGNTRWDGPAPPNGTHHYYFVLYALDIERLELPEAIERPDLEIAVGGHILDTTELVGLYSAR